MNNYKEIHVYFAKSKEGAYQVAIHSSVVGSAKTTTPLLLSVSRLQELRHQIPAALRQSKFRDKTIAGELARLGEELYEAIFPPGEGREVLAASLGALFSFEMQQSRLRLCLHFDPSDAELAWLTEFPWDVLCVSRFFPEHPAALNQRLSIVRWLDVKQPLRSATLVPQMRVLLIRAGARGIGGLQYHAEQDSIIEILSRIKEVQCESLDMPTHQELRRKLRTFQPDVLHFMGHGNVDEDAGRAWVYLRDEKGEPVPLSAQDVAALFSGLPAPQLVVLNACQSARGRLSVSSQGSVVGALVAQGVTAVIAMQFAISDEAARAFSEEFYTRFVEGASIDDAVTEGRLAMRLKVPDSFEWCTPALYMRALSGGGLLQPAPSTSLTHNEEGERQSWKKSFSSSEPPSSVSSQRSLILIRHEAYKLATEQPGASDAPVLFGARTPRIVSIDQTVRLEQRDWRNLEAEVKRLAARDGELRRTFAERDADIGYYGFPFVPLAVLAGYLAKNRQVHVFEYVSGRFQWEPVSENSPPPLNVDVQTRGAGTAARICVSVSALVDLNDCRQVLPDSDVMLDLYFAIASTGRGSVRREDQLKAYARVIRETLDKHISANRDPNRRPASIHLFAAVPVSLAFYLGDALTASWLPECFVYNYGLPSERPRYKWKLSLQAAFEGRRSVRVFK